MPTLMAQVMSCMETAVAQSAGQVENDINQISQSGSVSGAASAQVTGSTSSSSTSDTALTQLQVDVTNWSIATQCQTNTLKSLTDAMSATTQNIKS